VAVRAADRRAFLAAPGRPALTGRRLRRAVAERQGGESGGSADDRSTQRVPAVHPSRHSLAKRSGLVTAHAGLSPLTAPASAAAGVCIDPRQAWTSRRTSADLIAGPVAVTVPAASTATSNGVAVTR